MERRRCTQGVCPGNRSPSFAGDRTLNSSTLSFAHVFSLWGHANCLLQVRAGLVPAARGVRPPERLGRERDEPGRIRRHGLC